MATETAPPDILPDAEELSSEGNIFIGIASIALRLVDLVQEIGLGELSITEPRPGRRVI